MWGPYDKEDHNKDLTFQKMLDSNQFYNLLQEKEKPKYLDTLCQYNLMDIKEEFEMLDTLCDSTQQKPSI